MRKLLAVPLIASFLFVGGCVTTQPQVVTRYNLDPAGNLVQTQEIIPGDDTGSKVLETALVIGLGLVGIYFVGEIFDVWDEDEPEQTTIQQLPALIPTGGSRTEEWSTDFVQPVYQPL